MELSRAQTEGYLQTEKEINALAWPILKEYRDAGKEINETVKTIYAESANVADKYGWLIQHGRKAKLDKEIMDTYKKHDNSALVLTLAATAVGASNNYYRQKYILFFQVPFSYKPLDKDLLRYVVTGQQAAWDAMSKATKAKYVSPGVWPPEGSLSKLFLENSTAKIRQIQAIISSGLRAGTSYTEISERIAGVIGKITKEKATGQLAKALRIVRTEGARAMNAGAYASALDASAEGVQVERIWNAVLDSGTRPAHGSADGQIVGLNEPFVVGGENLMYPADPAGSAENIINCRCSADALANDFRPDARRGRDPVTGKNEVFGYKTFNEWAKEKGLTKNKHGQMVG